MSSISDTCRCRQFGSADSSLAIDSRIAGSRVNIKLAFARPGADGRQRITACSVDQIQHALGFGWRLSVLELVVPRLLHE